MYEAFDSRVSKTLKGIYFMIEEGNIDLFEKYQHDDLTSDEKKAFEARLVYDSEFKESYEKYLRVGEGISEHYRSELKNKLKDFDKQLSEKKKISYWKLTGAIAVVFILGITITRLFSANNYETIVTNHWKKEICLPVKMSTKGKYDDAMNAFKMEEWSTCIKELQPLQTDTANYYLGLSYYEIKEYQKAIATFEQIPTNSNYIQNAQFRLGLLYLLSNQSKDIEKATNLFQQLSNQTDHPEIVQSVKIILEKIK